ncbi:acyltransferase family protein [Pseudomonas sp. CGJS7]|uniref:acyltransferase family protein n=1 Tax=Pseudomonas sp. CGJS7 TaxID=3109348 RepID=UPI00300A843A
MAQKNTFNGSVSTGPAKPLFSSIQMLRAVAAMLVVLLHFSQMEQHAGQGNALLPEFFRYAFGGVDLFFVISGFVMVTVARGRYQSPAEARRFALRRAWRIFPIYWIYTCVLIAAIMVSRGIPSATHDANEIVMSFLLLPQAKGPMLAVGWTLIHELYFYLVGALAIAFVPERRVPAFLLGWGALTTAIYLLAPVQTSPWLTVVASPLTWEFIAGAMIGLYVHRFPKALAPGCAALGAVALLASFAITRHIGELAGAGALRALLYGPASALIVLGMAAWERHAGGLRIPKFLTALGDASYSLYLSHSLIIFGVSRYWRGGVTPWMHELSLIAAISACIVFSLISYRWLEKPMLAFGETYLFRRSRIGAAQPA